MKYVIRPMLAASIDDVNSLIFPLIATPKIDGIRCLTIPSHNGEDCYPVTRTLKPIPNIHIHNELRLKCPVGLDGELIVPAVTFQRTASMIMSHHGKPKFIYHVFDHLNTFRDPDWLKGIHEKYEDRLKRLKSLDLPDFCCLVPWVEVSSLEELNSIEEQFISQGYEGVCLRSKHSPYKFGRSSIKEHWLMKLKRFTDSEAVIIGYDELMRNHSPEAASNLGYSVRRTLQSMLKPANTLGALHVRDINTGVEFKVGSGFSESERDEIWTKKETLTGSIITYKFQPHGVKDKPRSPIFKGFRKMQNEEYNLSSS